jgi:hypothetical protein
MDFHQTCPSELVSVMIAAQYSAGFERDAAKMADGSDFRTGVTEAVKNLTISSTT